MSEIPREPTPRASLKRVIRNGLLLFVILLAILALIAWLAGDPSLEMEYEGFD